MEKASKGGKENKCGPESWEESKVRVPDEKPEKTMKGEPKWEDRLEGSGKGTEE